MLSPTFVLVVLLPPLFSCTTTAGQSPTNDPIPKFPWIQNFASIGDSYSAGLGAGPRIDFFCSRYGHSYPNRLHTTHLGPDPSRTHNFLACSGAKTADILTQQIPSVPSNLNLLTITAGGNDIGLSPILNDCIYQFYFATPEDCANSIASAQDKIKGDAQLYSKITALLSAAAPKMNATHSLIYLTGYASFFGTSDHLCDNVTWAVWRDVAPDKQFLTLDLRIQLNDLVHNVNKVLRRAVENAGPGVRFIDYDEQIRKSRGRYCESGVMEPAPNRPNLSFYEWDTVDSGEALSVLQRTGDDVPLGSFEADIASYINRTLDQHPEWDFAPQMGRLDKSKLEKMRAQGIVDDAIWWLLPDTWKRVFHLREGAHEVVAGLIVEDIEAWEIERETWFAGLLGLGVLGVVLGVGVLGGVGVGAGLWRRSKARVEMREVEEGGIVEEAEEEENADDDETLAGEVEPLIEPVGGSDGRKGRSYDTF